MKTFFKILAYVVLFFMLLAVIGLLSSLVRPAKQLDQANLGVIEVDGVITQSLPILEQIDEIEKHPNIKALVVRIDSPGGGVGASQEIYLALKKLNERIPVIASMGGIAASGGLYVSLGATKVYALPGTLTGSMGVLLQLANLSKLLERISIEPITLKSGHLKDSATVFHPMDSKSKDFLQGMVASMFDQFKRDVISERKLSESAQTLLSDGRVVSGEEAVKLGLVHEIGTFHDAVNHAKDVAKIEGDSEIVYLSREPQSILEKAFEMSLSGPVERWLSSFEKRAFEYRLDLGAGAHP